VSARIAASATALSFLSEHPQRRESRVMFRVLSRRAGRVQDLHANHRRHEHSIVEDRLHKKSPERA